MMSKNIDSKNWFVRDNFTKKFVQYLTRLLPFFLILYGTPVIFLPKYTEVVKNIIAF